jgi:nucleoside diphosphate kinase
MIKPDAVLELSGFDADAPPPTIDELRSKEPVLRMRLRKILAPRGLFLERGELRRLSPSIARSLYAEHADRNFFEDLIGYVSDSCTDEARTAGEPGASHDGCSRHTVSFVMNLSGFHAVAEWRRAMGPTDPGEARLNAPGSARALYGASKQRNGFHGSDSLKSAHRELALFFGTEHAEAMRDRGEL